MKTIEIQIEHKHYPIYIGNVLNKLTSLLNTKATVLVITDETVKHLYLNELLEILKDFKIYVFNMGEAESKKNLQTYEACIEYALNAYLDRHVQVIAFGGGAVGDFAGFFASTYKRGVPFINLPTTLLAHDSAVGGKVAVNVGGIKNVVGTFYQPRAVVYHTPFLKTLNDEEIRSGFGEVFKHDLLHDGKILENLIPKFMSLRDIINNQVIIEEVLYQCILIKKHYIEGDVLDQLGIRQALNLGHTLAHAIEILYQVTHGEAVAFGICFDLFLTSHEEAKKLYQFCKKYDYFNDFISFEVEKIIDVMKNDKKNKAGYVTFVGLEQLGKPIEIKLTEIEVKNKLNEFLNLVRKW